MAKKKPKPKTKAAIKLSFDDGMIIVQTLKPKRITHYGFGSFLEKYDPEEVEITAQARKELLECPSRSGLQGMEFFAHNVLAWGSPNPSLAIPIDQINVEPGAKKFIQKFAEINGD